MSERQRGELILLVVTAIWGTTFVTIHDGLAHVGPFTMMALRFGVAAVLLTPLAAAARPLLPSLWPAGAALGALAFAGFAWQTLALQHTSPAHAAFGTALVTVLVPVLACLLGHSRWRASTGLGLALAGGGIGLLLGADALPQGRRGDALAAAAALAFAGQVLLLTRLSRRHAAVPLVAVQSVAVCLLSGVAAALDGEAWPAPAALPWGTLAYLGAFASAACCLGQALGQARTSATRAAFIYALEPLFAAGYAWLSRGDRLSGREWLGGLAITAAALVADRPMPAWRRR